MLEIKDLTVCAGHDNTLLKNITFSLHPGECLGLTGASGSGKTTMIKAIMGILPQGCSITGGDILMNGQSLRKLSPKQHRTYCGTVLGFIPQNPMTAFDPHMKIGDQIEQTFRLRLHLSRGEAKALAAEQLKEVNLTDRERIMNSYPNQLSGGMLQRVAMACLSGLNPQYILADEPTSALDEENRDHLLMLLKTTYRSAGILFVSHDACALKDLCNETMIFDSGELVERQNIEDLLRYPQQAWTK